MSEFQLWVAWVQNMTEFLPRPLIPTFLCPPSTKPGSWATQKHCMALWRNKSAHDGPEMSLSEELEKTQTQNQNSDNLQIYVIIDLCIST